MNLMIYVHCEQQKDTSVIFGEIRTDSDNFSRLYLTNSKVIW